MILPDKIFIPFSALGGMRPEDEYNETNKRHTMPHPPDHIPDLDTTPTHRPPKEKKEKDKVYFTVLLNYQCVCSRSYL